MSSATLPLAAPAAAPWRAWVRRARVPAAVALAVAVAAIVAEGPARTFTAALARAFSADPGWVLAAVGFEILSFAGYVLLLWHVAGRESRRFGLLESYRTTLAGAAATRLLPTAGAGGAALTLWTLQKAGHRGRDGLRTLLTFLVVLYAVFLGAIVAAGVAAATSGAGPAVLGAVPAAGAAAAIALALAFGLRARRGRPTAAVRGRVATGAAVLGEAVVDALALVRRGDPRLLGAVAWWGFDLAVLWAAFHAVGAPPAAGVLVLGYFLGQVANTIPVPGSASGGLLGVLIAFGVAADLALAAVLAYRAIAIWLPAPAGAHALAGLRRSVARWAAEDARAHAPAEPAVPAAPRPACPLTEPLAA